MRKLRLKRLSSSIKITTQCQSQNLYLGQSDLSIWTLHYFVNLTPYGPNITVSFSCCLQVSYLEKL